MLFDELEVETITNDGKLFVNAEQLSKHVKKSAQLFIDDSKAIDRVMPLSKEEISFVLGISEGMKSIFLMLVQAYEESELRDIETVEDILERFKDV